MGRRAATASSIPSEDCDDGAANGTRRRSLHRVLPVHLRRRRQLRRRQRVQRRRDLRRSRLHSRARPAADGTSCGTAKLCRGGTCVDVALRRRHRHRARRVRRRQRHRRRWLQQRLHLQLRVDRSDAQLHADRRLRGAGHVQRHDAHLHAPGTPLGDGAMCGTGNDYCKIGRVHDADVRQRHDRAGRGLRRRRAQRHEERRLHARPASSSA